MRCSLSRVLTPSPNSVPSGSTTAARPPISAGARSAPGRGRPFPSCGRSGSYFRCRLPRVPPKGGLVTTMSTRSSLLQRDQRPCQRVVMAHEARVLDAVQQHVGDAEHVRQLLLSRPRAARPACAPAASACGHSLLHVTDRAGQEPARAAGGIEQGLARMRIDAIDHEGRDGARRVVLAGIAGDCRSFSICS